VTGSPQKQKETNALDTARSRGANLGNGASSQYESLDSFRVPRDLLRQWRAAPIEEEAGMADASGGDPRVHNLTVEEVARGLTEGRMVLVDVREPNEVAVEAYPDAVVVPLSNFDPAAIPDPQGRQVVFACRSGRRSVTASLAAQEKGYPYDSHLAGGILAWKAAGLPTQS
jgi:rhodanese-related sulfurtransferase